MGSMTDYAQQRLEEAIRQGDDSETVNYWRGYRDCAKVLEGEQHAR